MITLTKREMVDLTPSFAEGCESFNTYEAQRNIRPLHVDGLIEKIQEGHFRFGEVAFASYNGSKILMNGQHICRAVAKSKTAIPCVIEEFDVDTESDLSKLFRQFEILPRSIKDMVKVEAHALKLTWPLWISSL